jgi:hypothetical protein
MSERILEKLEPVRRRQLQLEIVRYSAMGLLAGSLLAVGVGVWRWQGTGSTGTGMIALWATALVLAGPALGALVGLVRGRSWRIAAAAVDARYQLKDRAVSAVDFIRRGKTTAIHQLQLADAEQHLEALDPRRVAPFRLPTSVPYAVVALVVALGLLLWPRPTYVQAKPAEPLAAILAAADDAEETLEDIQEVARKENDPKLKELVQKLADTIEQMKMPGVDTKEALAKLSEMQAAITAQQAQFNVGLVDAQMQALGEAMASTQALEGAGQALQQGKYDKAAEQLDKAEPKLDSARKREQVEGQMGEGASETETTHMPEGRQTAARTYKEQYQKYRRMTEAALNTEPIPLGHRQTIRRYFELIRPQGDEADKADAATAKAKPGS